MGIKGLFNLIYPYCTETHIKNFRGSRIAVDAMPWLQKGMQAVNSCTINKFNKRLFFNYTFSMLAMMEKFNIHVIIVIDGKAIKYKESTTDERKEKTAENEKLMNYQLEKGNKELAQKYARMSLRINKDHLAMLIEFLQEIKVEYQVAPNESDSQIAQMVRKNQVDQAVTDDSDVVMFGAEKIIFKLTDQGNCLLYQPLKVVQRNLKQLCIDQFQKKKERVKARAEFRKKYGTSSTINITWIADFELQRQIHANQKHLHFRSKKLSAEFEQLNILSRANNNPNQCPRLGNRDVEEQDISGKTVFLGNDNTDFIDFIENEYDNLLDNDKINDEEININNNAEIDSGIKIKNKNKNDIKSLTTNDTNFMSIKSEFEIVKKEIVSKKDDADEKDQNQHIKLAEMQDDEIEEEYDEKIESDNKIKEEKLNSLKESKYIELENYNIDQKDTKIKEELPVQDESINKKESLNALKSLSIERRYEFTPIDFNKEQKTVKPEKLPESIYQSYQFFYLSMNMKLIIVSITGCDQMQPIRGIGINTLIKIVFNLFYEHQSRNDVQQVKIKKEQLNVDVEFMIREVINKLIELKQNINVEYQREVYNVWIAFKFQKVWDASVQAILYSTDIKDRNQYQNVVRVIGDIQFENEISLVVGYDQQFQQQYRRMNQLHQMYDKINRLKKMNDIHLEKNRHQKEFMLFDNSNMLKRKRVDGKQVNDITISAEEVNNGLNYFKNINDMDKNVNNQKEYAENPLMKNNNQNQVSINESSNNDNKEIYDPDKKSKFADQQNDHKFNHLQSDEKDALASINQAIEDEENGQYHQNEECNKGELFKLRKEKTGNQTTHYGNNKMAPTTSDNNKILLFKSTRKGVKNEFKSDKGKKSNNNQKKITDQFMSKKSI